MHMSKMLQTSNSTVQQVIFTASQAAAGEHQPAAAGCQQAVMQAWMPVSNSVCPHFKNNPFPSLPSLPPPPPPPLVPLHRMSGSSPVWCALYYIGNVPRCRHHCETLLKDARIWVRLTGASRLFTRADIAFQLPGVSLNGTVMGFLGYVYWWQPGEQVKVFACVCVSQCFEWLTHVLPLRESRWLFLSLSLTPYMPIGRGWGGRVILFIINLYLNWEEKLLRLKISFPTVPQPRQAAAKRMYMWNVWNTTKHQQNH